MRLLGTVTVASSLLALTAASATAAPKHKSQVGADSATAPKTAPEPGPGDAAAPKPPEPAATGTTSPPGSSPASTTGTANAAPGGTSAEGTAAPGSAPEAGDGAVPAEGGGTLVPLTTGPPRKAEKPKRPGAPRPEPDDDAEEDQAPEIRSARDTLGGHFVIGAVGGLFVPIGSVDDTIYQSDVLGPGLSVGGDLGYGVSRTVVFGAYGELGMPKGENCSSCSGSSFSVGPFVRYHLVQGVVFDPWLSYGAGFRKTTLGSSSWTGVDVARLALGGDFYAWPSFGFGPFIEMSIGTFFDGTPKLATHSVNAHFNLGLRLVFDSPGK